MSKIRCFLRLLIIFIGEKMTKKKNLLCVGVVAFAVFLATFNETFMNVALGQIAQDTQTNLVAWLVTAYMLGAAVMVPVSSFLYRKIPTKVLFAITMSFLIVGSVVGGLCGNSFWLAFAGRIIQSLGSGLLVPLAMNVALQVAPREKLGSYMGFMAIMTTLGPSVSILLSGVLLDATGGNWHVLFWTFGALCAVCLIFGLFFLGNIAELSKPKLDILSVILIGLALVGILFALSYVFTSWWIALIAIAVGCACMALFVWRQKKIVEPLINFAPLKNSAFTLSVCINMIGLILVFALNMIIPLFLGVKGESTLISSLALFPAILLSCVAAPIAGRAFDKHGVKWLLPIGFMLMTTFIVLISIFIGKLEWYYLALLYIPVVVGSALIIGPVQSFGLSFLKPAENPHGVTIFSTGFQIAGALGSAFLADGLYNCVAGANATVSTATTAILVTGLAAAAVSLIGLVLSIVVSQKRRKNVEKTLENHEISVKNLMKTEIYSVNRDASVVEAMKNIVEHKISSIIVTDDNGNLAGYLSDGDIVRYLSKNYTNIKIAYSYEATDGEANEFMSKIGELSTLKVSEIANEKPYTIDINADLGDVCRELGVRHLKKAPVLDNGKLVGVISRSDITKFVMNLCVEKLESNIK